MILSIGLMVIFKLCCASLCASEAQESAAALTGLYDNLRLLTAAMPKKVSDGVEATFDQEVKRLERKISQGKEAFKAVGRDKSFKAIETQWGKKREDLSVAIVAPLIKFFKVGEYAGLAKDFSKDFNKRFAQLAAKSFNEFTMQHDHGARLLEYIVPLYLIDQLISGKGTSLNALDMKTLQDDKLTKETALATFLDRNGAIVAFWQVRILQAMLKDEKTLGSLLNSPGKLEELRKAIEAKIALIQEPTAFKILKNAPVDLQRLIVESPAIWLRPTYTVTPSDLKTAFAGQGLQYSQFKLFDISNNGKVYFSNSKPLHPPTHFYYLNTDGHLIGIDFSGYRVVFNPEDNDNPFVAQKSGQYVGLDVEEGVKRPLNFEGGLLRAGERVFAAGHDLESFIIAPTGSIRNVITGVEILLSEKDLWGLDRDWNRDKIVISNNGKYIALLLPQKNMVQIFDGRTGQVYKSLPSLDTIENFSRGVAISGNGESVAFITGNGYKGYLTHCYKIATGEKIFSLPWSLLTVLPIKLSDDGQYLIGFNSRGFDFEDPSMQEHNKTIFDLFSTDGLIVHGLLENPGQLVDNLLRYGRTSADGRWVAAQLKNGSILVWDLATVKVVAEFQTMFSEAWIGESQIKLTHEQSMRFRSLEKLGYELPEAWKKLFALVPA